MLSNAAVHEDCAPDLGLASHPCLADSTWLRYGWLPALHFCAQAVSPAHTALERLTASSAGALLPAQTLPAWDKHSPCLETYAAVITRGFLPQVLPRRTDYYLAPKDYQLEMSRTVQPIAY